MPGQQLPPDFDEQIIAANSLLVASAELSKPLDTFASWSLGGFAAALALFITNSDAHRWIGQDTFSLCGKAFALVLILTSVQKYLSIIIVGSAASAVASDKAAMVQVERRKDAFKFNVATYAALVESTVWVWPKFIRDLLLKPPKAGDFMRHARMPMNLVQIQALCTIAIAITLLVVACAIAWH